MNISVSDIARWVGGTVDGDDAITITALAKIEEAHEGDLSFVANLKYAKYAETTGASALLVNPSFPDVGRTLIRVEDPYIAFLQVAKRFAHPARQVDTGIHPTAVIGDDCELADDVAIGAHVVLGRRCKIGRGTILYPGTVINDEVHIGDGCVLYSNTNIRERCRVGDRVIIQPGAVIGADGFGYAFQEDHYEKIPQTGIVVIEDDVEIGANTTIDRATLGETRIGRGTKLDNLIQVAHNVTIGEHTAIAAQTGISGSTHIGNFVKIGGQSGFVGHITIGDESVLGAQSGITKNVPEKSYITGRPAKPVMQVRREEASLSRLPGLLKSFRKLELRLAELENQLNRSSDQ
jgi:UDP-3-O-[3-hydroxymyristoyl] glucosamine N-acyltransferase